MAETQHTLQETIDLAVKLAVQKAKRDMHPIGKTWLTFGDEDPSTIVGGGWEKVKSYCLQCSDDTHAAGTTVEAGLPNIMGQATFINSDGIDNTLYPDRGALYWINYAHNIKMQTTGGTGKRDLMIDASRSNPIYGRSNTVQPNTIIINVWKRVS